MSADFIWLFVGIGIGASWGYNKKVSDIPKALEQCTVDRNQQEIDIAYYKKLTKKLVEENAELRKTK